MRRLRAFDLDAGWRLSRLGGGGPGEVPARVPGAVQTDLARAGAIPSPYHGEGHRHSREAAHHDWVYRLEFADPLPGPYPRVDLVFEGLDTFATAWLNGQRILESANMFRSYRVPVAGLLAAENLLEVRLDSPLRRGRELSQRYGPRPAAIGDDLRVYVRKAQLHFGWDFVPSLVPIGIWRGVRLEAYHGRIAEVEALVNLRSDLRTAQVEVRTRHEGEGDCLEVSLRDPEGEAVFAERVAAGRPSVAFEVKRPHLWWPRGLGPRPLYRLAVTLWRGNELLDRRELAVGFRRLRLVRTPPESGERDFHFEVNGTPFFAGGANWVPADAFLHRVSRSRYRRLLSRAAWAGINMLRVWGGGVYESDVFYELADELGILVWQDFMFASAAYPEVEEFLEEVRLEAGEQVKRLRHHPALAVWCGNNEDYLDAPRLGAEPARRIYERVLPEVVARHDPGRAYLPGSPYGGDRHVWEVWHGGRPYQDFPELRGRFVSEFGMLSLPSRETEERFHPRPLCHDRECDRKLAGHLQAAFGEVPRDPGRYRFATWALQAEALRHAFGWRTRFLDQSDPVGGALVWQLNDVWPAASWSLMDFLENPKPALYLLRRLLRPRVIFLEDSPRGVVVWLVNAGPEEWRGSLTLLDYSPRGEVLARSRVFVAAPPRGVARALWPHHRRGVVRARGAGSQAALWPEPPARWPRYDPGLTACLGQGGLELRSRRPVRGVYLEGPAELSDNYLDLFPGEVARLGGGPGPVVAYWIGGGPKRLSPGPCP